MNRRRPVPAGASEFARYVLETLREHGYEAYWAGGCVRDRLLGRIPKDYDVATNALPDQIRRVFGRRRTVAVGAAFGVISVRGPRGAGSIEVATFREDATYSDGRRPDAVRFSTPERDAQRRDFTINGMFLDPVSNEVLDWVGGQQDLRDGVVRAIGDPHQRIGEDKLRMLRAVRFATTYEFQLDPDTAAAIRLHAVDLAAVSQERISGELLRILADPARRRGLELLAECHLLAVIVPEFARVLDEPDQVAWRAMLRNFDCLPPEATLAVGLAAWLDPLVRSAGGPAARGISLVELGARLRLPKELAVTAEWLLANESTLREAPAPNWPRVQRILADPRGEAALELATAIATASGASLAPLAACRRRMSDPGWNPPPLVTGDDLRAFGLPPGPEYRPLLDALRDAQLEGQIATTDEALALLRTWLPSDDGAQRIPFRDAD